MIGTLLLFCHSIFRNCDKDSIEKKVKINQVRLINLFNLDDAAKQNKIIKVATRKYKECRPYNPSRICFQIQPSKHNYYGILMVTK